MKEKFDGVLIDAPCSGLGVIRRHPDIRWNRTPEDLLRYQEIQSAILNSAAQLLAPGGTLVYATCSTEPEEGEQVVERFLKSSGDFDIIDDGLAVPDTVLKGGFMRTWPHKDGMDGFFAVAMRKK